ISHGALLHQNRLCLSNKCKCQVRALYDFSHYLGCVSLSLCLSVCLVDLYFIHTAVLYCRPMVSANFVFYLTSSIVLVRMPVNISLVISFSHGNDEAFNLPVCLPACFIRNSALGALLPQLLLHKWNCHLVSY
uniref:Uncharacterized protein n=1 Tax=Echinococcus canadensis TaxID=519352 RepID=A0A915ETW0_9CEST